MSSFQSCVVGFVDTLVLFKKILPQREKYSQESLVADLLGTCYRAHDSPRVTTSSRIIIALFNHLKNM